MSNDLTLQTLQENLDKNAHYSYEQKKSKWWESVAKFKALITAGAIGAVGAVAISAVFPELSLPFFIAIGVGGFFIEIGKYGRDNPHSFEVFAITGVFEDMQRRIYTRELLQRERVAFVRKVLENKGEAELKTQSNEQVWDQFKQLKKNKSAFKVKYGQSPKKLHQEWLVHSKRTKKYIATCFAARRHAANDSGTKALVDTFNKQLRQIRTRPSKEQGDSFKALWLRFYHSVANELLIKSALGLLAGVWTISGGIGFGSLMFDHLRVLFSAFIASSWVPAVLACVVGFCVGVCYWMLMYRLLNKAIVQNLLWKKILKPMWRLFFPKGWSEQSRQQRVITVFKNIIALGLIAALIAISVSVNLASASEWLKSTLSFYDWLGSLSHFFSQTVGAHGAWLASVNVLMFMAPLAIMFSFEKGFETAKWAGHATRKFAKILWRKLCKTKPQTKTASEKPTWSGRLALKYIVLSVVAVGLVLSFALHVFGEGGISGEGVSKEDDLFVGIFETAAKFLDKLLGVSATPATLAVAGNVLAEIGEDGMFTKKLHEACCESVEKAFSEGTQPDPNAYQKTFTPYVVGNSVAQQAELGEYQALMGWVAPTA